MADVRWFKHMRSGTVVPGVAFFNGQPDDTEPGRLWFEVSERVAVHEEALLALVPRLTDHDLAVVTHIARRLTDKEANDG